MGNCTPASASQTRRRLWYLWLPFVVAALAGCLSPTASEPRAEQGVLDLRGWNFADQGTLALTGDWEFYWQQLLEPGETGQDGVPLEGVWGGHYAGTGIGLATAGYGTYRLTILLPENLPSELALQLSAIMTAYRVWLNGREFPGAGRVSADLAQVIPDTPNRLLIVPGGRSTLEINLQVANAQFRMGGVRYPLRLGIAQEVVEIQTTQVIYDSVIFILLLAAGSYFLLVFSARRQEHYRLWFGLLCLITAIRTTVAGEALLIDIGWPGLSWATHINIEYAVNFIGCALVPLMVGTLYRDQAFKPWLWLSCAAASAMVVVVLATPVELTVKLGRFFDTLVANAALFIVVVLVRATKAGAEHAGLFLLTVVAYALGILLDILRSNGVVLTPFEFGPALFTAVLVVQAMILARSFTRAFSANEKLTVELGRANQDLQLTNEAVQRFVPYEFLSLLNKQSIREVAQGDSAALEMEVLFCDLRQFTAIVEQLPAKAAFAFINHWLSYMEPVVHRHGGFVNQYLGDCIMALFTQGGDGAVAAGIDMLRANEEFNRQQTQLPDDTIGIGIGLSTGPMMIGTIGGQQRLDNGVVGDAVNVAARVEGMTKIYGTPFILTESVLARLARPQDFALRELDTVAAQGKAAALTIYEVLDGLPDPQRQAREATAAQFAQGLAGYRAGEFERARELFRACLAQDSSDRPSRLFVQRCEALIADPPQGWSGVTSLSSK